MSPSLGAAVYKHGVPARTLGPELCLSYPPVVDGQLFRKEHSCALSFEHISELGVRPRPTSALATRGWELYYAMDVLSTALKARAVPSVQGNILRPSDLPARGGPEVRGQPSPGLVLPAPLSQ